MGRQLAGKIALVTGAGRRVGRAIAEALGAAGADVGVHFHASREGAAETVATLEALGVRAAALPADLADPAQIGRLLEETERALGPVSILINSAARFDRAPFLDTPPALLEASWALNLRAPYLLSQAVARGMAARGSGDIVNILDIGGAITPWRGYSAYGITKAALRHLTSCLALELAPAIRVNAVAPGTVLPPEGLDPRFLEVLRSRIPQGRFGSPSDVAEAVLFFLTGPAFVTGQLLAVDGGRALESGPA